MSGDNELIALRTGGISVYGLIPPVLVFSIMGVLLTCSMTVYGMPWGKLSMKNLTFRIVASHADIGLKERTFNDSFKGVMIYVNKIDMKSKNLIDVFIEDKKTKNIVSTAIAPKGKLFYEPDRLVFHLRLYDGSINQVNLGKRSSHSINFDTYDIKLDLKKAFANSRGGPKDEDEMSLVELKQYLKNTLEKNAQYYSALIEYHKKFSIPFACLFLGVLAVPLGIHSKYAKRSAGLGLGLIFFLLYYLLLSAGSVFGEAGIYPPLIGMWLPNIVMGGLGLFLLIKAANDRRVDIGSVLIFFKKIKQSSQKVKNRTI